MVSWGALNCLDVIQKGFGTTFRYVEDQFGTIFCLQGALAAFGIDFIDALEIDDGFAVDAQEDVWIEALFEHPETFQEHIVVLKQDDL